VYSYTGFPLKLEFHKLCLLRLLISEAAKRRRIYSDYVYTVTLFNCRPSVRLSVCLCVCLSVCPTVCVSITVPVYRFDWLIEADVNLWIRIEFAILSVCYTDNNNKCIGDVTKAAARRSANFIIGKQKNRLRSVERGYPSHCRNSVKKLFPAQNSVKSVNRLLSYGQETIFNMAAVRHLELKTIMFDHWQRSFSVSGSSLWNSLPLSVRDPSLTMTQFCTHLKTFLFRRAYYT